MDDSERSKPTLPEKELPNWARDIQVAYLAYRQVSEEEKHKLSGPNGEGQIRGGFIDQANEALSSFLDNVDKEVLPEVIPLRQMQWQESINITTVLGVINLQSDPYGRYFLPGMKIIYRITHPVDSRYIPGNLDFVGTEQLRQHYVDSRYIPPESPDFRRNEQTRRPLPPYVWFDNMVQGGVMRYGKLVRKTWNLSGDDISKIVQHLADHVADQQTKGLVIDLESNIRALEERAKTEEEETKQQLVVNFKSRINNLKDAVIRAFGKNSLPTYIKLSGQDGQTWYYLRDEGKIVIAPLVTKKVLWGIKKVEEPDLTRAQETSQEAWLRVHSDLAGVLGELLKPIPKPFRDQIQEYK